LEVAVVVGSLGVVIVTAVLAKKTKDLAESTRDDVRVATQVSKAAWRQVRVSPNPPIGFGRPPWWDASDPRWWTTAERWRITASGR
jgi:hypothetical protein